MAWVVDTSRRSPAVGRGFPVFTHDGEHHGRHDGLHLAPYAQPDHVG
jgi:hypothetical protein